MGELPDWYPVLKVALELHVAPWELAQRPEWVDLYYAAIDGEKRGAEYRAQRAAKE